ncbi:MAG: hypothetical protein ACK6DK_00970 [Gemmatimonadota bacterium]
MTSVVPPDVRRLVSVARDLGPLRERMVFIGGAVVPLLATERVLGRIRATSDVDAIAATASYADANAIGSAMRRAGFAPDVSGEHLHRWRSPHGVYFDLVPAGTHAGGTASALERAVIEAPSITTIDGLPIRHASAAAMVALKWNAYRDRGDGQPVYSHDVQDIVALLVERGSLVAECREAPAPIGPAATAALAALASDLDLDDVLAAHLGSAIDPREARRLVRGRLTGR